jgi:GDA1/CD39 (nucleoside phosphatase) family
MKNNEYYDPLSIEAEASAELYRARTGGLDIRRRSASSSYSNLLLHRELRIPLVHASTQHGMMIDAGSQGTRLHVYEFDARVLDNTKDIMLAVRGEKLSVPTTDTAWTDRLMPGLDSFAYIENERDMVEQVAAYLEPLLLFAESVLAGKEKHWASFPIYLKATGGMRALPRPFRIRLINVVRQLFQNDTFNPFYFSDE